MRVLLQYLRGGCGEALLDYLVRVHCGANWLTNGLPVGVRADTSRLLLVERQGPRGTFQISLHWHGGRFRDAAVLPLWQSCRGEAVGVAYFLILDSRICLASKRRRS